MLTTLLVLPFAAALATWPVRRVRQIAAPLAALTYVLIAALAPFAARQEPIALLGRSLAMAPDNAIYASTLAIALALLMAGGGFVQESGLVWPSSLATFGLLLAAMCSSSAQLAGAFLSLAVLGIAFCLVAPDTAQLAMRTVIVLLCGTLLLLLAGWAFEASRLEDALTMPSLGRPATLFGLAVLLGVFPFGLWALPLGRVERPTAAFLAVCGIGLIASLRLPELGSVAGTELLAASVRWSGIATLFYGAIGALLSKRMSEAVSYAAAADLGVAVLALGSGAPTGGSLAARHLAYRAVACAVLWVAARVLGRCFGSDDVRSLGGAFRRAPLTFLAIMLAALSLAGLPPTAGFGSRTVILSMVHTKPSWAIGWALGAIGPAWALMRLVIASWGPTPPPGSRREPTWLAVLLLLHSLGLLVIGLVPNLGAWLYGLFAG